ncbi:MAG TPA: hypothetical protein VK874_07010 [Gaiellaceae bacterium]|nr:hypothetical protein [Gaiellaceae bacterium]
MGMWYTIGLFTGIGVGAGLVLAGLLGATRGAAVLAALGGAVAGALLGLALADVEEAAGGAAGGLLGGFGASQVVAGALRAGGTRVATAFLVGLGGVVLAVLALIPVVGYIEAVGVPAVAARLRRRAGQRYAGLRILARD